MKLDAHGALSLFNKMLRCAGSNINIILKADESQSWTRLGVISSARYGLGGFYPGMSLVTPRHDPGRILNLLQ